MTACRCSSRAALVPCFQHSHLPKTSRPFVLRFEACGTPTGGLSLHTGRAVPGGGTLSCCSREGFQNVSLNHEIWDPNSTLPWICVQLPQIALESKTQPPEPSIQRAGTDYCLWDNICFNQLVWYTRKSNKTSGVVQLWRKSSSYPLLCCKPSDSHSVSVALYCHMYCLLVCWCKGVKHSKPVPF